MVDDIFVDTNVLIHLIDGNNSVVPFLENKNIHVSFVTEMELLSKVNITQTDIRNINLLLDAFKLYDKIKLGAIIYIRNYRLKMADSIIAATANYYDINLLTVDNKFKNIPNCKVVKF